VKKNAKLHLEKMKKECDDLELQNQAGAKKDRGVVPEMQQAYDGARNHEQQMQDAHQRAGDLEACLRRDGERDRTSA
jgi:hypothetical protein